MPMGEVAMNAIRSFWLKLRIHMIEGDIATAEECQRRISRDLPELHKERLELLLELWALEQDQPA